jgi:predicted nucleic acid-binding protein
VSAVLVDSGAFIAFDKGDRRLAARLTALQRKRIPLRTSAAVIAQVWRGGPAQANLSRLLDGVRVRALDDSDARSAGELQASTRTSDVVDAHIALLVDAGDSILTSDPEHIARLLDARGVVARILRV